MKSDRRVAVAIVGAGFSGTMAAAQLARRGIGSMLIEGGGRAGQGAAYSTEDPAHLLNVPAGNMSAWPDSPDDFASKAKEGATFTQRRHFGAYLASILDEAVASGHVALVEKRVVGARIADGDWRVELDDGTNIAADALVLATGNQPPGRLRALDAAGDRLVSNPWGPEARAAIADAAEKDAPVLIVGTGLTMVDVILSLDAAGHRGQILAVSRRGQLPRGHADSDPAPVRLEDVPHGHAGTLLSWLRRRSSRTGWRAAIDSLRPHSHALWQSLDLDQQRRFLRHARPWWDAHRHRIAPQVADRIVQLIAAGRLQVVAGRVADCRRKGDEIDVAIARRGGGTTEGSYAYVFNCTGPLHDMASTADPLLGSLLCAGHARADPLGIGIAVDERSRVEGAERLWALGPLTKGRFWEIIAVPDIREQAAAVAQDIAREVTP